MKTILFFLLLGVSLTLSAQPYGYTYGKTITIQPSMVTGPSDLTNFPVLLSITDAELRSVGQGGGVENNLGYDIVFYTDLCQAALNHQVEKYDSTTGELLVWVSIPLLSATEMTEIQMYYGNSAVVSSTSTAATFNSNYSTVLHLGENPSNASPQMTDASGNGNSGSCIGSMSSSNTVTGKIASGIQMDETDDGIVLNDFDYTSSFTVSLWFNVTEVSGNSYQYLFSHGNFGTYHSTSIYFGEASLPYAPDRQMLKTIFQDANDGTSTFGLDGGTGFVDGNWHYYTFVVGNSGGATVYVDGTQVAYLSFQGGNPYDPATNIYLGARSDLSSTRYLGGRMDEVRILNVPRSADWIASEYNNQNSPTLNFTVGAQVPASFLCVTLPIGLFSFTGNREGDFNRINWITANETNSDYFQLQRSEDGVLFEPITHVNAAGMSNSPIHYTVLDDHPLEGINYYRLKQTNMDGLSDFSEIISIDHSQKVNDWGWYPNPLTDYVYFQWKEGEESERIVIRLYNEIGEVVHEWERTQQESTYLDLSHLKPGLYFAEMVGKDAAWFKLIKTKQ